MLQVPMLLLLTMLHGVSCLYHMTGVLNFLSIKILLPVVAEVTWMVEQAGTENHFYCRQIILGNELPSNLKASI